MRVLSLFSGGGLGDYGFEQAGFELIGQVEINEYCQKLLEIRWPKIMKHSDIETFSLQEDFLAKTFPLQTSQLRELPMETVLGFGQSSSESFVRYDPNTRSWKMYQRCFLEEWAEFSETWPQSGTMRNGKCYLAECLEPNTYAEDSGFLPTPTASDFRGGRTKEAAENCGRSEKNNLRDYCRQRFGWTYPKVNFVERMMALPKGWTDLNYLETAKTLALRNGSAAE